MKLGTGNGQQGTTVRGFDSIADVRAWGSVIPRSPFPVSRFEGATP